eukprot:3086906-Rhodomonas_salina.1
MPAFCPNVACGGWICHVCRELSGEELPVQQFSPSQFLADSPLLYDMLGSSNGDDIDIDGYLTQDGSVLPRDAVTVMACPICCTGMYQFFDHSHGALVGVRGTKNLEASGGGRLSIRILFGKD